MERDDQLGGLELKPIIFQTSHEPGGWEGYVQLQPVTGYRGLRAKGDPLVARVGIAWDDEQLNAPHTWPKRAHPSGEPNRKLAELEVPGRKAISFWYGPNARASDIVATIGARRDQCRLVPCAPNTACQPCGHPPQKLNVQLSQTQIRMTRAFAAPRDLVFDAMVTPELVERWLFGPDGWKLADSATELRAGGQYRYIWKRERDDTTLETKGAFRHAKRPEHVVAADVYDAAGHTVEAVCDTVLSESNGWTTMTLTMQFASSEARDTAVRTGIPHGMEMGYRRLDVVLASLVVSK